MARRFRDAGIPADAIAVADGAKLSLPKDIGRLGELIEYTNAGFVVLDSLRRLAPGVKENDSDSMAPIVAAIANLAREHNAAIGLIHHRSSKDGAAAVRGSSAIKDQADLVFGLERTGDACCLKPIKFRIDEEPEARWLRSVRDGTGVRFEGSEPVRSDREAKRDEKAQAVLDALKENVQSVREIAEASKVPKTTVDRILKDLKDENKAQQQSGGWTVPLSHSLTGWDSGTPPEGAE
jgi:RecA-family ATPase